MHTLKAPVRNSPTPHMRISEVVPKNSPSTALMQSFRSGSVVLQIFCKYTCENREPEDVAPHRYGVLNDNYLATVFSFVQVNIER